MDQLNLKIKDRTEDLMEAPLPSHVIGNQELMLPLFPQDLRFGSQELMFPLPTSSRPTKVKQGQAPANQLGELVKGCPLEVVRRSRRQITVQCRECHQAWKIQRRKTTDGRDIQQMYLFAMGEQSFIVFVSKDNITFYPSSEIIHTEL